MKPAASGFVLRLGVLLALSTVGPALAETSDSDRRAIQVADQVMRALGGKPAWDRLAGVSWTFEVASHDTVRPGGRTHAWDKHSGWHRVEGRNRQGQSYVIVHRLDGSEGRAWVDGHPIEGDSLDKLVRRAKSMWTNDTYWMLMPYKLRDPGVHLRYDGHQREGGRTFDRLALSFDKVGETPGDRYWVYVNRANHRIEKWEYVLQDDTPPPKAWTWEGWERHDGLWFPTTHHGGDLTIFTRRIETSSELPPQTFSAP